MNKEFKEINRLIRTAKSDCKQRNYKKLELVLNKLSERIRAISKFELCHTIDIYLGKNSVRYNIPLSEWRDS